MYLTDGPISVDTPQFDKHSFIRIRPSPSELEYVRFLHLWGPEATLATIMDELCHLVDGPEDTGMNKYYSNFNQDRPRNEARRPRGRLTGGDLP